MGRHLSILASAMLLITPILPVKLVNAAAPCGVTTTATYSIDLCLTAPAPGTTVIGALTVSATTTITVGAPKIYVRRLTFSLDNRYLLSDFQPPWSFSLESFHWIDATHLLTVSALMSDNTTTASVSESLVFQNGVKTPPVNSNPPVIYVPPSKSSLVMAAVGDGASGEPESQAVVNMMAGWNPDLFTYLGDVYENGAWQEFQDWYDPSFGALRTVSDPTIGNHEYQIDTVASGYAWYWNHLPTYFSFDSSGWHFISLNGNHSKVNDSIQISWLNNDLANHAGACIIAYWHQPRYSVGAHGGNLDQQTVWAALANAHATIVLNGHDHDYQRWQPMDANGTVVPTGITEFVAGTGGHSETLITTTDPRVVINAGKITGALRLTLSPTMAQTQFFKADGTLFDSATIPCKGHGSLSGAVTDFDAGTTLAGATVSFSGGSTTTDAAGHFAFPNVPVGTYTVTVASPNHASQTPTVTVGGAAAVTLNAALDPLPATLTGTVTDARSGSSIVGAAITSIAGATTTDSSGRYTLPVTEPGSFAVTASAAGYLSQTVVDVLGPNATVVQNFGLPLNLVTITGQVTAAATGSPIQGAAVAAGTLSSTTDGAGHYSLGPLPAGSIQLTASAPNYDAQSVTLALQVGTSVVQNFALSGAPVFTDGFENGGLIHWTSDVGLALETTAVHTGQFAVEGNTTTGQTYARLTLPSKYTNLYYRIYFNLKSNTTNASVLGLRPASGSLLHFYVDAAHHLALRNDLTAVSTVAGSVTLGAWHSLEVHVVINGTSSTLEVWVDGTHIPALEGTAVNLGVSPVAQIVLGETNTGRTYDVVYDDVVVQTTRIGP